MPLIHCESGVLKERLRAAQEEAASHKTKVDMWTQ